jgi:hypothetical protein
MNQQPNPVIHTSQNTRAAGCRTPDEAYKDLLEECAEQPHTKNRRLARSYRPDLPIRLGKSDPKSTHAVTGNPEKSPHCLSTRPITIS